MKLFGGFNVTGSHEVLDVMSKRSAFIAWYCAEKGWEEPLSMEQILEIRSQEGWKNPK